MRQQWLRANWDRVSAWGCIALGALVLLLGWLGVSDSVYPAAQLPFVVSGGIGGALLVALGATLLISADLRDEWHKLDEISSRLEAIEPHATAVNATGETAQVPVDGADEGHPNGQHPVRADRSPRPAGPQKSLRRE